MRQSSNGVFTTILMLVPVVVIPVIAMFGLPSLPENRSPQDVNLDLVAANDSSSLLGTQSPSQPNGMQSLGSMQNPGAASSFGQQPTAENNLFAGHSQPANSGFQNQTPAQQASPFSDPGSAESPQPVTPVQSQLQPGNMASAETLGSESPFPAQNSFPQTQPSPESQSTPSSNQLAGTQQPSPFGELGAESAPAANAFPQALTNNQLNEVTPAANQDLSNSQNQIQQVGAQATAASPFGNPADSTEPNRFNQNFGNEVPTSALNASAAPTQLNWQSAVQKLNSYGITNFLLQPGSTPGTFHFSCFYVPDKNLRISHRFEAEAADPLKAFADVLQQIQKRQQQSQPQR